MQIAICDDEAVFVQPKQQELTVTVDRVKHKLLLKDILYFESQMRKILAVNKTGEVFTFYDKLDALEQQLASWHLPNFLRVHQSYIANLDYFAGLDKLDLYLRCDDLSTKMVPMSRRKEKDVRGKINIYLMNK